jgi:nucleoside-diphosphate-sugar epimerase
MIVGTGLIANSLIEYDAENVVFFASGVSNSQEMRVEAFAREADLILKYCTENADKLFVYFSTYSIADPSMQQKAYILHKIKMEELIAKTAKKYCIIRTSNLVGDTPNPNTIANYLTQKVRSGEPFEGWNIKRNLLDVAHLCAMTHSFILQKKENQTIYLVSPISYSVLDIVVCLERILQKKANYTIVEKGANFEIDTTIAQNLFETLSISTTNYLDNLLEKYVKM